MKRRRWLFALVAASAGVLLAGTAFLWWQLRHSAADMVEIFPQQVRDDGSGFHWTWVVRGKLPWQGMKCDEASAQIVRAGGVQGAVGASFGPYAYTFDLDVCSGEGNEGRSRYQWSHKADGFGGNVGSNNARSIEFPGSDRDERFRAIQKDARRVQLPARVPLAVVDGKTVYLDIR